MSTAFRGKQPLRRSPLIWEYGRQPSYLRPGNPSDVSPNLAIRDGRWKLLMNADESSLELYDFKHSFDETRNVADTNPKVAGRLSAALSDWWKSLPQLD